MQYLHADTLINQFGAVFWSQFFSETLNIAYYDTDTRGESSSQASLPTKHKNSMGRSTSKPWNK